MTTPQESIRAAIDVVGSNMNLSRQLGVSPSAVTQWGLPCDDPHYRQVPAERCPAIEAATDGLVRCEDLRPDVPWHVLRQNPPLPSAARTCAAIETGVA